jgi:predicted TIM-barrel fold metal-dependent hydrolase
MKSPRADRNLKLWWRTPKALGVVLLIALSASSVFWVACRSNRQDQDKGNPYSLTGSALAEFTSLEPIDAHTHISQTGPAFARMLERLHMHVLDILYVDDTDPNHTSMEPQKQDTIKFIASSMGHVQLCTTFNPFQFNNANFSKEAIKTLNQDFANGAVAAKIWKNVGMQLKNQSGQYVMPDDPRFAPIYSDIAAHDKTLIIHAADPDAAWDAQYPTASGAKYYSQHPQWDMSKKPDAPSKKAVLDARDHLLVVNPELRVIGAHLGSMENQLDDLANRLDRYPNFAVDTAARVRRLPSNRETR